VSLSGSAGTPGCVATFAAYIAPYGSRRIDAAAGNESGFPGCAREEGPRPLAIGWLGGRRGGLSTAGHGSEEELFKANYPPSCRFWTAGQGDLRRGLAAAIVGSNACCRAGSNGSPSAPLRALGREGPPPPPRTVGTHAERRGLLCLCPVQKVHDMYSTTSCTSTVPRGI
jgi:hypothetical protein